MTHDEIAQLDADGLDAAIDKAKGITHGKEVGTLLGFPVAYFPKKWSTDIRAAWELFLELPLPRRIHQDDGSIYVFCGGYSYGPTTDMEYDFYVEVDEEETPNAFCVAVCRIRLMWKQT